MAHQQMAAVFLLASLLCLRCSAVADVPAATDAEEQIMSSDPAWDAYKQAFHKHYDSQVDEAKRYRLFKQSQARVDRLNRLNGHVAFGLNPSSDRLETEKWARGSVPPKPDEKPKTVVVLGGEAPIANPTKLDWRLTPAVTPVKNQGQCGSCWAFSTAETVESTYILQVGKETSVTFSPQQVASCTAACDGCAGGWPASGYEYLQTVPGLASSWFWPYAQGLTPSGACSAKSCTQSCSAHDVGELKPDQFYIGAYAPISGYSYATPPCQDACLNQNLAKLASSLQTGPVSVCVNAGVWNDYKSGVLTAAACGGSAYQDLDHCVQLVGYNTAAPQAYWIVRNSWDTIWGMDGYVHLEYNANTCGLANQATIPTINTEVAVVVDAKKKEEWLRLATQASSSEQESMEVMAAAANQQVII